MQHSVQYQNHYQNSIFREFRSLIVPGLFGVRKRCHDVWGHIRHFCPVVVPGDYYGGGGCRTLSTHTQLVLNNGLPLQKHHHHLYKYTVIILRHCSYRHDKDLLMKWDNNGGGLIIILAIIMTIIMVIMTIFMVIMAIMVIMVIIMARIS